MPHHRFTRKNIRLEGASQVEPGRYIAIDLKTFYASVECADRGLDPFTTNLIVADPSRGEGTICLAITPAMKALGIRNRCRVHEIPKGIKYLEVRPRMRRYMEVSAQIVAIYLKRFSAQDVYVYSVDECLIDAGPYLKLYDKTARQLAQELMDDVWQQKRIKATAGVGTNLFLAKVGMDILAKHSPDCIAELDQEAFFRRIWHHRPITDVWGIGPGTARSLERMGALDLAGVTRLDPQRLRNKFGVNAERLIDHAYGRDPLTMADLKSYTPKSHSLSQGQVLMRDYRPHETLVVLKEMIEAICLSLVEKGHACSGVSLYCRYSWDDLAGPGGFSASQKLAMPTDSRATLQEAILRLWEQNIEEERLVRGLNIGLFGLTQGECTQLSLFDDVEAKEAERKLSQAEVQIKSKYGAAAIMRGCSLMPCATGQARANQVGGHHS